MAKRTQFIDGGKLSNFNIKILTEDYGQSTPDYLRAMYDKNNSFHPNIDFLNHLFEKQEYGLQSGHDQ